MATAAPAIALTGVGSAPMFLAPMSTPAPSPSAPLPAVGLVSRSPVDGAAPANAVAGESRGRSLLASWLRRPAFWVVALTLLFGLPVLRTLLRPVPPAPPVLGEVPSFSLRDQTGRTFNRDELLGKTWVADFVFTRCPTACPLLSSKMVEIQHRTRQLGSAFHLVSFSVDPEHDTPEVLAAYGAQYHADPQKWSFLTGTLGAIEKAVVEGFKIGVDRHKTADDFFDIVHGEHLVVVDGRARIRGYFDISPEGLDRLMSTVGVVANEP